MKMDSKEKEWGKWTELWWIRRGTSVGICECSDEYYGFMNYGGFLDYLRNCSFSSRTRLHAGSK